MWGDAARQWRRLLTLNEADAEALLALADYHVSEGMRYRSMVSGPISLADFGQEELEQGVTYLARLRQVPGGHGPAELRLAELALTLGRWSDAIRYATSAASFSGEPKAHAILAAALLRIGDTESASREFAQLLDDADDATRGLYNDPDLFFARRGLDLRRDALPASGNPAAWDERDPRLLTPENERLLEHYARVTIAAVRCASRPGRWDGARTEPGVLLIRYGEPASETRVRPEITDDGRLKYEELRYHYPEYTIVMEDQSLNGRFHLSGGGAGDSLSYFEGVRLIKRIKERYDPHRGEPPLRIETASWVFPRLDTGVAVTAIDLPASGLELQWDGKSAPFARVAVATRWRALESGRSEVATQRFEVDEMRGCPDSPGFCAALFDTLDPGTWRFSLEVEDRTTGRWTRLDTTVAVPAQGPGARLTVVGPTPCWQGRPEPTGTPLEQGTLVPTARPAYGGRDTLVMYFEVHGLKADPNGLHHGSLIYAVRRMDRRPWWRRVIGGKGDSEVSVEAEAQGPGDQIVSRVEVRLSRPVAGEYEFTLHCVDDIAGKAATGRMTFQVCGRPGD